MASAYGFDIGPGGQGAIFALSASAKRNRRQTFGAWEAELRKDSDYVCVRGSVLNLQEPLADVIEAAHGVAEDLLDILAVEERNALLVIEPHNNLVWRSGPQGLKLQLTSGITFGAEGSGALVVTNAAGEVIPDPPYMPPQHHFAYRYFRYSQAAQNVLDAYRNMFLAFESLLDYVEPKQAGDGETDWLKRALTAAHAQGLDLSAFAKPGSTDARQDFLDAHYSTVRCAAFHSKSSSGHALRPGSLRDHGVVLQQLLAVQTLAESLLKSEFSVRLLSSGFGHSGFASLLSGLVTLLVISVADCPTIEQLEQLVAKREKEENLPEGTVMPVTFAGANAPATDEWLFISEIKAPELSFSKVATLRLVAKPTDHIFVGGIIEKMNHTLIRTDLDLAGVLKLVLRVRCILRNPQSPKRGFSH
jgi:hypothetical protein